MGIPVLIIGKSGSGKSTSLRNFQPGEVGIVNVLGKPLPFRNRLQSVQTDDYKKVYATITKAKTDCIVIDDSGYLMTNQFMRGHSNTGAGNAIFTFYNDLGDQFWHLVRYVVENLPPQRVVYFMMHEDKNDFGDVKPKTIGKMLDEKVCVEGMFTIVLRSMLVNGKHVFRTQTDGMDVCKTPIGLFDNEEIDNDLKIVDNAIREYYYLNENKEDSNND